MASEILDAIDLGLIVWDPAIRSMTAANAMAREHGLVQNGCVIDTIGQAAEAHRMAQEVARQRGCRAAAQQLVWRGQTWYVRTTRLASGELILCRVRVLREIELLRIMQTRFGLTDRQADVLRYLLRGRTTREIADKLELARRTVRMHEEGLRRALHVENNYEVLCVADQLRRDQ